MMTLNRRNLLTGTAALAGLGLAPLPAFAVDMAELNKEPAYGDMALGAGPDSKVVMIEYASASCPHCAAFANDVFPALKKEYIDTNKIRFVLREFPHNDAGLAGFMLARSLPKDAYFPVLEVMFKTQAEWLPNPHDGLLNIAKQAGITQEKFDAILKDEALAKAILEVRAQGEKFGVTGIPTFFINGEMLNGEQKIETLREKIDPLLG